MVMWGGASQVLAVSASRSLSQRGPSDWTSGIRSLWMSALPCDFELTIRMGSHPQSCRRICTDTSWWLHSPVPAPQNHWFEEGAGEGVGEQTNLYKLQSYSIYKAQTEAEPWGTEDGNNLQSRFAWSCAAFESSDSSTGGDRRDAGDTWVAGSTSASHSTLPAPCSCRVRLLPQGTKAILVLFRPDSP